MPCRTNLSYVGVWLTRATGIGQRDFDCSDTPDSFEGHAIRVRIACSNVGLHYLSLNLALACRLITVDRVIGLSCSTMIALISARFRGRNIS